MLDLTPSESDLDVEMVAAKAAKAAEAAEAAEAADHGEPAELVVEDLLIDVSIDGMCGVY